MKFYHFRGDGLALGSTIVVMARRIDTAVRLAMQWASDHGVSPETVEFEKKEAAVCPMVVYGWNGDY